VNDINLVRAKKVTIIIEDDNTKTTFEFPRVLTTVFTWRANDPVLIPGHTILQDPGMKSIDFELFDILTDLNNIQMYTLVEAK